MKLDVFDDEVFKKLSIDFYVVVIEMIFGKFEYFKIDSVFE